MLYIVFYALLVRLVFEENEYVVGDDDIVVDLQVVFGMDNLPWKCALGE